MELLVDDFLGKDRNTGLGEAGYDEAVGTDWRVREYKYGLRYVGKRPDDGGTLDGG